MLVRLGAPGKIPVQRLAIHFCKALGGAEHGYRLDRLVGRDHHHGGGTGSGGGVGDVDGAEDVGLDPLAPVRFEQRHMLECSGMEHEIRPKIAHQAQDARAITHIGEAAFDPRTRRLGCQHFKDCVQRRLGILDHQEPRGAESDDAVADFRADRAAAAGDDDRLALHHRFEPLVVDLHARPQQEILDIDRGEAQRLAALVKRRQPAGRKPEPPRLHQNGLRLELRCKRRRREHKARHLLPALGELGDRLFEFVKAADHRNPAHRLAPIRR